MTRYGIGLIEPIKMPNYEIVNDTISFGDTKYKNDSRKVNGFKPQNNAIKFEDLDSFTVPTSNSSCRLYNRDENVKVQVNIDKRRNKVTATRCPYTNITHCDPLKNHKCFICTSKHSGFFCSFSILHTLSRKLIITSNSNGTFKNLGQFFFDNFENHKANFIGNSGATMQRMHEIIKNRPDTKNKINLLYNPNFIDIAKNPNDLEYHFKQLVELLNTCLSLDQIPILIFVPLTHTNISYTFNNFGKLSNHTLPLSNSLKQKILKNNRDLNTINRTMKELNDRLTNLKTYDGKNIVHKYFSNFPSTFYSYSNKAHLNVAGYRFIYNYIESIKNNMLSNYSSLDSLEHTHEVFDPLNKHTQTFEYKNKNHPCSIFAFDYNTLVYEKTTKN